MISEQTATILNDYLISKYQYESSILLSLLVAGILKNGVDFYAKLTDKRAEKVIHEQQLIPEGQHKITTLEIDIDILNTQRKLCKELSISEIENLISYTNRQQLIKEENLKNILNNAIDVIISTEQFSNQELLDRLDISNQEFCDITGYELDDIEPDDIESEDLDNNTEE